jgi:hypothetical protein
MRWAICMAKDSETTFDEKGSQLQPLFSPSLPPFRRLPSDRRRGDTFGKEKDSFRKFDAIPLEMLGTC